MTDQNDLAHIEIRRASIGDAEAIAQIHVSATIDAYSGIIPSESIEIHSFESRLAKWKSRLAESPGESRSVTLVGVVGGEVMGFVNAEPGRSSDGSGEEVTTIAEVTTIYVDSRVWRHGLGAELMHAASRALAATGYDEAYLYVLADNVRACEFYEATGWVRAIRPQTRAGDQPAEACYRIALRGPKQRADRD